MEGQSGVSELSVISWVSVQRGSTVFVLKIKGKPANIKLSHECLKELETFSGLVVCIPGVGGYNSIQKNLLLIVEEHTMCEGT